MNEQPAIKKRQPRFQRVESANFRLQERDREILKEIHKFRFLDSRQIIALLGGSRRILARLNLLFHAGYLDRPRVQNSKGVNSNMVYALGRKGAELLSRELDLDLSSLNWTAKNRESGYLFIDHTLAIAEFIIMVRMACKQREELVFVEADHIINHRKQKPKDSEQGMAWRIQTPKANIGMIPDYVFGIYDKSRSKTFYYFLEADRSTMPIKRSVSSRSSFYKKMIGYHATWKQRQFLEIWGFNAARVLTLTISKSRMLNMIEANKSLDEREKGSSIFLFSPEANFSLDVPERILEPLWINGEGQTVGLI